MLEHDRPYKEETSELFEGVCVNYRHPDPRRGEPRVGSAPNVAFPGNPVDPVDPVQNSVRLKNHCFYNGFDPCSHRIQAAFPDQDH